MTGVSKCTEVDMIIYGGNFIWVVFMFNDGWKWYEEERRENYAGSRCLYGVISLMETNGLPLHTT